MKDMFSYVCTTVCTRPLLSIFHVVVWAELCVTEMLKMIMMKMVSIVMATAYSTAPQKILYFVNLYILAKLFITVRALMKIHLRILHFQTLQLESTYKYGSPSHCMNNHSCVLHTVLFQPSFRYFEELKICY